ncbi:MAG: hypothetical protein ACRAVC_06830 [Trichormus sp.]|jgi:hypothetical protein
MISFIESGGKLHPLAGGEGQSPRRLGQGHGALVASSPCPMPNSQCPKTPSPCGWSFLVRLPDYILKVK